MGWGIGTWDGAGNPTNKGLVAVNVVGYVSVAAGVLNATYGFNVPAGRTLRFLVAPNDNTDGTGDNRRIITVSGNNIVIGPAPNNVSGADRFPLNALFIIGYIV